MKLKIPYLILMLVILSVFTPGCKKEDKTTEPVADTEGNIYKTIQIGNQIWMTENLKVTHYNEGTTIPLIEDGGSWKDLTTGGYCWYNNDSASFKNIYGALYNGYTVSTGKLCPTGWHVPSREEWQELRDYLGDSTKAGGKIKEAGTVHWLTPNKGADNKSSFTALPSGIRYFEGSFASISTYTGIWSGTTTSEGDEWCVELYYGDAAFSMDHRSKNFGFSVRCLKD